MDQNAIATLVAKEEIRELAMLYSRGVDRKDIELLKDLYAKGSTDTHGDRFDGSAEDYIVFLERSFPHLRYSGHHICNHLVSVNGETGEGEVYALAYHLYPNPDGKGGMIEDLMAVRYVDRYCKEGGRWKFAQRVVTFDFQTARPVPAPEGPWPVPTEDPSCTTLSSRLFASGPRG
jgi:hypothetical protein